MKRFSYYVVTLILSIGCIGLYLNGSILAEATQVEIQGKIGENGAVTPPLEEAEPETEVKLAEPKQNHIALTKFPNTGSISNTLTFMGFVLLLLYLLVKRWEAHRKMDIES